MSSSFVFLFFLAFSSSAFAAFQYEKNDIDTPYYNRWFKFKLYPPVSNAQSTSFVDFATYSQSLYGPNYPLDFNRTIVLASPITGCTAQPQGFYQGQIVLVNDQGTCDHQAKAAIAQNANASGILVWRCQTCSNRLNAYSFTSSVIVTIPVSNIPYRDGLIISNALNKGVNLTAWFPGSGPLADPAEFQALVSLGKTLIMTQQHVASIMLPNLQSNNYIDPCVPGSNYQNVHGVRCIDGHVTELVFYTISGTCSGSFNAAIKNLTYVTRFWNLCPNIGGVFPDISDLKNLTILSFTSGSLTSFQNTVFSNFKLQHLEIVKNSFATFPSVALLNELVLLDLSSNKLQAFPTILSSKLISLSVSGNSINSTISALNFPNLKYLDLSKNKLTGNATDLIVQCSSLVGLDISSNNFAGFAPTITSSKLLELNFNSNNLKGDIGCGWPSLNSLLYINMGNNLLTDPVCLKTKSPNAVYLDVSRNKISSNAADTTIFLNDYPTTLTMFNISSNLLAFNSSGGGIKLGCTYFNAIQTLILSYNKLKYLPSDLFLCSSTSLQGMDFSNNVIEAVGTSGLLNSFTSIYSTIQYLYFHNNKFPTNNALPSFISTTSIFQEEDSFHLCPQLVSVSNPLVKITLDASYYNFRVCKCQRGFYGKPPNCLDIPYAVSVNQGSYFSDSMYGDQRLTPGLSTSWEMRSINKPSLVLSLTVNTNYFSIFNDLIEVYEGGSQLNGERIFSLRGNNAIKQDYSSTLSLNNGLNSVVDVNKFRIPVLTEKGTVVFKSLNFSGSYINATFSSSECPEGYKVFVGKCYNIFSLDQNVQIVVFVISGITAAFVGMTLVVVVSKKNSLVIKSASAPFCILMLLFLLIMSLGSVFYAIYPSDLPSTCHIRPWLTTTSLVGVLASLLVKADRIRKIFTSTELVVQAISNLQLFKLIALMLSAQSIIMIGFSATPVLQFEEVIGSGSVNNKIVSICNVKGNDVLWMGIQFAYITCFLIAGCYEAWSVRKVPTAFNEGPHIASCFMSLAMLLIILVPVNFLVDDNPNALLIIRGVGQCLISITMTFFLFGPKLFYILEGRENDKNLSSIGSKSSSTSSSSSSVSK